MEKVKDKIFTVELAEDKRLDAIAKAFGCKTRRNILRLLAKENLSIWNIAQQLDTPVSTISEHIKILVQSGIVSLQERHMEKGREKDRRQTIRKDRDTRRQFRNGSHGKGKTYGAYSHRQLYFLPYQKILRDDFGRGLHRRYAR